MYADKLPNYEDLMHRAALYFYHHKTKLARMKYEEAVGVLNKLLKKSPRKKSLWLDLGNALSGARRYQDSLKAYENCIKLGKSYLLPRAYYNRGLSYIKLKEYNHAIQEFKTELIYQKLDPDDDSTLYTLWWIAHLYGKIKDYPNSIKTYKQLIKKEKYDGYYYELAMIYAKSDDIKNAKKNLETCFRLSKSGYYYDRAKEDKLLSNLI